MEAMATYLHLNNTALSEIVESRDELVLVVTKVEGEKDELKDLAKMMTRERTTLSGRR